MVFVFSITNIVPAKNTTRKRGWIDLPLAYKSKVQIIDNFKKRAFDDEANAQTNHFLALNSKHMPHLPLEVKQVIFGLVKPFLNYKNPNLLRFFIINRANA
ncbi:MAG: hypothetical protein H0W50_09895 [Parachlamydiaceae bacterium]|nr:hypothetical protein [Parachlamydiaceae bacterium]